MKKSPLYLLAFLHFYCQVPDSKNITSLASGKIERYEDFPSQFIDSLTIDLWLPNGYSNEKKYPVLYMNDGQMLFDSSGTWNKQEWEIDEVFGEMIEKNVIEPVLIVAIWNPGRDRHAMYFPQKPFEMLPTRFIDSVNESLDQPLLNHNVFSDNYLKFIVKEVKPFIDRTYSTLPDQANTFIAGSSMGGLISMYAVCEYPEIFGGAICMSTHWPGIFTKNDPIPNAFYQYLSENVPEPAHHKFYFDHGDQTLDSLYGEYQHQIDSIFYEKGYSKENYSSKKFPGTDHSERAWSDRIHIPVKFLFEK